MTPTEPETRVLRRTLAELVAALDDRPDTADGIARRTDRIQQAIGHGREVLNATARRGTAFVPSNFGEPRPVAQAPQEDDQ